MAGMPVTTTFTITAYQSDPLSRLDLSFHNNTFDSTPLNVGNTVTGLTPANAAGAIYNDSDGAFKSRLNTATPAGPFISATRERNAERLAGRFLGFEPPFTPQLAPNFLYPGLAQSTFRLLDSSNGGATTAADVAGAGFFTDVAPYANRTSARGVFPAGATADFVPFGWTFLNGAAPPTRPQ